MFSMKLNWKRKVCIAAGLFALILLMSFPVQAEWVTTSKGKMYTTSGSPGYLTGWQTIGGSKYYFKADGIMVTSKIKLNGTIYYFKSNGKLRTGLQKVGKYTYYFGTQGYRHKGWQKITKSGKTYRYYFKKKNGRMVTGLETLSGKKYYFASNGRLQYGWITLNGKRYYAKSSSGVLAQNEWLNSTYYFLSDCTMAVSQTIDGKQIGSDGRYVAVVKRSAWDGNRYYDANGTMVIGWQTIDGKKYFFKKATGEKVTGWLSKGGKIYFFNKEGVLQTNCWVKSGNDRYRIGSDGSRQIGITKVGKKYYYLSKKAKGKLVYGWISTGGKRYFGHRSKGYLITGLANIGGKKYYFYSSGEMAKSVKLYVGSKEYSINSSGVITSETKVSISGSTKGSEIAKFAVKYVGNPYVWGGTSLTSGADCSGFVYTVFQNFGISLPRVADDQMKASSGTRITSASNLLPGDLVFYGSSGYASHVALYIGDGQVVHASNSAPYPQGGIKISNYDYNTPIAFVRYWS